MPTILGLDLGKFKGLALVYNPATTEARFTTVPTDRAAGDPRAIVVAGVLGDLGGPPPALAPGSHDPPTLMARIPGRTPGCLRSGMAPGASVRGPPACGHVSEDRWVKGGSKVGENGVCVDTPGTSRPILPNHGNCYS